MKQSIVFQPLVFCFSFPIKNVKNLYRVCLTTGAREAGVSGFKFCGGPNFLDYCRGSEENQKLYGLFYHEVPSLIFCNENAFCKLFWDFSRPFRCFRHFPTFAKNFVGFRAEFWPAKFVFNVFR